MEKTLREKKIMLKKVWEDCFGIKIEDKINKKGLDKFWDDATTIDEATELLTCAAINIVIDSAIESAFGHNEKKDKDDEQGGQIKVCRLKDNIVNRIFDETFSSVNEANDFIKEQAMNSTFKVSDFKVIRTYD